MGAALDLARTEGHPLYPAIHLIAYTGMRRGEALALTWGKVDLGAGRLIIDATLGRTLDKGLVVEPPKTESGRRVVDLDAATIEVLSCHWDIQQQTKKLMREAYAPNNMVFAGPEGEWLNPMSLTRAVKRLGARVGAENLTVRSLRHFHASVTLQSGQSVVIVSKRLGHASVSIAEDIYAHSLPGWQKQAAEAFAKAMEG